MSERKALLKIGFVQFVADVSTALVLEERLAELTQVTSRWIDPDDNPNVEPNGLVLCPSVDSVVIDVEIIPRRDAIIFDPEWWPSVEADRTARALREAEENDL
tara:strand:- start:804 stop:1112 length:309 start_codon:yes stop_codon:yes gene_type:complete